MKKTTQNKGLKPVIFRGPYNWHAKNEFAQNVLLKALSDGITDINELKKLSGMKSAAQVYRTFDKMSIRKEYHQALSNANISLDYIVKGIKDLCDNAEKDDTKLKAYQTLLKSVGLDKYETQEADDDTWEDAAIVTGKQRSFIPLTM